MITAIAIPENWLIGQFSKPFTKAVIAFFLLLISSKGQSQNCTVNAGLDKVVCAGEVILQEGNTGGTYIPNTLIWSQVSGPNTATITNNTSLNPTFSNLVAGAYIFRISNTCQIGGTIFDDVNIIVNAAAAAVTPTSTWVGGTCYTPGTPINLTGIAPLGHTITWSATSSIGLQPTFNGSSLSTFTGNNPTIQIGMPANSWCSSNSTNTINVTVTSTNNATNCTTQRTLPISFKYNFGAVNAWATADVCGSCADLLGSCPQGGSGAWSVSSSPVGAPPVSWVPSATAPITKACNLISGTYTFRWTVSGAACVTDFKDVTVSVNTAGAGLTKANAGKGRIYCPGTLPSIITLEGNSPEPGETVQWTQFSGAPVTITNPTLPATPVTGLTAVGAPYMFIYTKSGGGCTTYDTVYYGVSQPITINPALTYNYCGNPTAGSNLIYSNSDGLYPYLFGDSLVVNTTYESGPVSQISHSLQILYDNFTNIAPPVSEPYRSLTLGQTYRLSYTKERLWPVYNNRGLYVYNNIITFNSNSCVPAPNLRPGVYVVKQEIITPCSTIVRRISINVSLQGAITTAGTDQVLSCSQDFSNLAGNILPCMYSPSWSTISIPSGATDPIHAGNRFNPNASITSLIPGIYKFVWYANAGPTSLSSCPSGQDTVLILVSNVAPAVPVISGGGMVCANVPVTITASTSTDAVNGAWSVSTVPTGGTYSISPSLSSNTIVFTPTTPNTVYTLTWQVSNSCGTAFANTTVTTNNNTAVVPDITNTSCQFQGAFGTLTATPSPTPLGVWSSNNPNYTLATPNSTTTTVSPAGPQNNRGAVTFYYTLDNTATGGCGVIRDSVTFLPGYSTTALSAFNQCNVSSFPAVIPITITNITPYLIYNLYVTGPGSPSLSTYQLNLTGSNYQTATVNLTVNMPGQYRVGFSTVQWGGCFHNGSIQSILIQVSDPAPLAIAGPDINLCGASNSGTLNAQPNPLPSGVSGFWTVDQVFSGVAPILSNASNPNSAFTFNGGGSVRLKWTTSGSNTNCGAGSVDYLLARYIPAANAGQDDFTCYDASSSPTSMGLNANSQTIGIGAWSVLSEPSGSSAIFVNPALPSTTVTGLINGSYNLRWTITDPQGICPPTIDDVNILVNLGCTLLPLELNKISATMVNEGVNVVWETSNEEGGEKYILERSISAQEGSFSSIVWMDYSELNKGKYHYTDQSAYQLGSKFIYYRVKVLNRLNKVAYSKIVSVRTQNSHFLSVYPTVLNKGEYINIEFPRNQSSSYEWRLVSANGKLIQRERIENNGPVQINTGGIGAGSYILQISSSSNTHIYKIIIN